MSGAFDTLDGIGGTAIAVIPPVLVLLAVATRQFPHERYETARKRVLTTVGRVMPGHRPYLWLVIGSLVVAFGAVIGAAAAYNASNGPVPHVFDTYQDAMSQVASDADSGVSTMALVGIFTAATLPVATVTAWVVHHLLFWVPAPAAEVALTWTAYIPVGIATDGLVHALVGERAEDNTTDTVTSGQRIGVTLLYLLLKPLVRVSNVLLPSDSDITVSSDGGRVKLQTSVASHMVYWFVAVYLGTLIGLSARVHGPLERAIGPDATFLYLAIIICLASLLAYGPAWLSVGRRTEVGL